MRSKAKTSPTCGCRLLRNEHRWLDRRWQNKGARSGKDSKEFGMHSTAFPCHPTMLRLVESPVGHSNGALGSKKESGWRAASRMMQEWTHGRMCSERFIMKETDHQKLPHSCSTANACIARAQLQRRAKTFLCNPPVPLPCDYQSLGLVQATHERSIE